MKFIFTLLIVFIPLGAVEAHIPVMVDPASVRDVYAINDPTLSQAFYGNLSGFPHTYEVRVRDATVLRVEVLIPEIVSAVEEVNGIVIRETGMKGRVEEVARLLARDASWEQFFEPWGGDWYRRGSSFETTIEAGVYRIEVSTPDNYAPYVLVVGTEERDGGLGYIALVERIAQVKAFYGKSAFAVLESRFVYLPLVFIICIVLLCGGIVLYRKKRRRTAPHTEEYGTIS